MEQADQHPLHRVLHTTCDLNRPIPPGTVFGTLATGDEIQNIEELTNLLAPALPKQNKGFEFDPNTRELRATIWGKVYLTEEGLFLEPSWNLSSDNMLLTVEVDHVDCLGQEITAQRLFSGMPKGVEHLVLSEDQLVQAITQARNSGGYIVAALARGLYPEPGIDGKLQVLLQKETKKVGTLRQDGSMDFRERGGLVFVSKGDRLAELHAPRRGTPGVDIFGASITPAEPKEVTVKIGQGVDASPEKEGVTLLTASRNGVFHLYDDKLEVSELLEIDGDVDLSSGNIRAAHGSVHIKGSVRCGFTVEAQGDVIIDEIIEEADISAGGVVVAGGVIMNGRNRITAKGNVTAKFFQNAIIQAGGDVVSQFEISHCRVMAGGNVTSLGRNGIISGGHVISGGSIVAHSIGNEARTVTIVEIRPANPKESSLIERRAELTDSIDRMERAIGHKDAITMLMTAPEEDRRILAELIKARGKLQADIRVLDTQILQQRQALRDKLAELQVRALERAYSGVEVIIAGKRVKVTEDIDSPSFRWNPDTRKIGLA